MTVPIDYELASVQFDRFLVDVRDTLDLTTTNQAWGTLLGVFDTFRRRLTSAQALDFAKALPPLPRAAFIQDLRLDATPVAFAEREALDREVMDYHRDHQFAPPGSIAGVAAALARHADRRQLDAALATMPEEARQFWEA